ncbi:MAG: CDP-alcohol phosphatidyltransferase family protein [Victivallales bacterium]|jgi:phosphatidylglycerophosphate synthase
MNKEYKNKTLFQIRREQYKHRYEDDVPYIKDWTRNPYTYLKARFYIEASSVILYFLLKTKIAPNYITAGYAVAGLAAGVLLAVPGKYFVLAAAIIFFINPTFDWVDGAYSRMIGKCSFTGHILDVYAGYLPWLALQVGLGFYVAQKPGFEKIFWLIPLIPFFYAANLVTFMKTEFSDRALIDKELAKVDQKGSAGTISQSNERLSLVKILSRAHRIFQNIFDNRARGVDLICLVIILEAFTGFFISWAIFAFLVLKQLTLFLSSFISVVFFGRAEAELRNQLNAFRDDGENTPV